MSSIAIIGAGLSGLRAALELATDPFLNITIFEKSSSVGGRIATRRFGDDFINHGAEKFTDFERVLDEDPTSHIFLPLFDFSSQPATEIAKALRYFISKSQNVRFFFGKTVTSVTSDGILTLNSLETFKFDKVLITSPLLQTHSILNNIIYPDVLYSKKVLFIGQHQNQIVRWDMPETWSEAHFELSDQDLVLKAEDHLQRELKHLDLKKWRYCEVIKGVPSLFGTYSDNIILAGDAFDPQGRYSSASAWLSGMAAGTYISNHKGN